MSDLKYTPVQEIDKIYAAVNKTFRAGTCRPLEHRRKQLYALARMAQENADAIAEALHKDLGKPPLEAFGYEIAHIVNTALDAAKRLDEWAKPEVIAASEFHKAFKPTIQKTPKGPVLIITPWNFPFSIVGQALTGAIAAGNPAIVKPSEISANVAKVLGELVPKYLDPNAYAIVNGAVKETSKLLELKWAHIHYTGNGRIARIIATAAAKHLTPVSLELGGKSPVLIDPEYDDLTLAAKRILFGKNVNAGQICVAPDYVLVGRKHQAELVKAFQEHLSSFFPDGPLNTESFCKIVSPNHFQRLKGLLDRTKGKIVAGGKQDASTQKFEITIVADVDGEDSLMSEEIFGPILSIIPVDSLDEAIDFINSRDHPLAFYAFTNLPEVKQRLLDETLSGGLQFNDVLAMVPDLPFSGVGESGYGYQYGKYTYDDFTHMRSTVDVPKEVEQFLSVRYPPYTQEVTKMMSAPIHQQIPQ